MKVGKPEWIWLKRTVVLVADSFEVAKAEYERFKTAFPNNQLHESSAGYDTDGQQYRVVFWRP